MARANGVALPDTVDVRVHDSEEELETNFGLLHGDAQGFTWICHEAVADPAATVTPRYFRSPNGVRLASVVAGYGRDPSVTLYRSTDGGCSWSPAAGLGQAFLIEIAFDPADPARALGVSYTDPTGTNGIWESTDGGATWTLSPTAFAGRRFRSIRWSSDPAVVWATAAQDTPPAAWVYRSVDHGANWTEIAFSDTSAGPYIDLRAISPSDPATAFIRADAAADVLFRTTNGGASWAHAFEIPDDIQPSAYDASGTLWIATRTAGVYRSDGFTFSVVPGAPFARSLAADSRGVWIAADVYASGFALARTTNAGASFVPVFKFTDLRGPDPGCPAASDETTICAGLWPALRQKLGITPTPTPDSAGGIAGCGCDLGTGAGALPAVILAAAGAAFLRRRVSPRSDG